VRLRYGAAMAAKGGRTAVVAVEVREGREPGTGRLVHRHHVGHLERAEPFTVDEARDRLLRLTLATADVQPCTFIDVGTPQGEALARALRGRYPPELHRAHAYPGTGARSPLFAAVLDGLSKGTLTFEPGLPHRAELDRALVFYGGGKKRQTVELESEDEALVIALGLATTFSTHGPAARPIAADE